MHIVLFAQPLSCLQVTDGCQCGCRPVSSSGDQLPCRIATHIAGSQDAGDGRAHPQICDDLPLHVERHQAIEKLGVWGETEVGKDPGTSSTERSPVLTSSIWRRWTTVSPSIARTTVCQWKVSFVLACARSCKS